jgi:magnesium transporter
MSHYKKISNKIQELIINNPTTKEKLIWLNIGSPEKKEIEYLRKKYTFNLNHLQVSSSRVISQRPILIEENSYFFLILHFPIFSGDSIIPAEVDFFVSHGYLITLHNNNIDALNNFFNSCKKSEAGLLSERYESSAVLLYELLEKLMLSCYPLLDENSKQISEVEDLIFSQEQKKSVTEILTLRRNIINMKKIMQNHKNILKKITEKESSIVPKTALKKYYNNLIEHSKRIWETIELQKELIEALHATNESLLNDKISNIMKTLTIFSVIVFPLTLLAAIFGMNTESMPLAERPDGFWIIITIMIFSSLGMLWIFEKKRWL